VTGATGTGGPTGQPGATGATGSSGNPGVQGKLNQRHALLCFNNYLHVVISQVSSSSYSTIKYLAGSCHLESSSLLQYDYK